MTLPFEFQTTGSFHLSDDGLSDDSNFEHLSSEHIAQVSEEQNLYWLGRLVLASRLARTVVRLSTANATSDDLDMELLRRKTSIPYSARLALVNSVRNHADSDAERMTRVSEFHAYCVIIGRLTLSGSQTGERDLDMLIGGETSSNERDTIPANESTAARGDQLPGRHQAVAASNLNIASDMQVAHYSMALKEYGDKVGREPRYVVERSPTHPSFFAARVDMNGSQYEGMARTKKQAQHLASRAACQAIGIAV